VFTTNPRQSGRHKQDDRLAAHKYARIAAITATVALGAGFALAAPLSASAAAEPADWIQQSGLYGSGN
jgi:ABC-type Fe2+-enterobactin transport system substrate-binding protein